MNHQGTKDTKKRKLLVSLVPWWFHNISRRNFHFLPQFHRYIGENAVALPRRR